jgi:ribosomal protein S18 acetylase RimI-like enzyme
MTIVIGNRPYRGAEDFWPVRDFLATLYPIALPAVVWDVRRWDGSHCHSDPPGLDDARAVRTRLWEAPGGRIVAATLSEGGRQIHPHAHPEYRRLLDEVFAWSEQAAAAAGLEAVLVHVWDHDAETRRIAERRGYRRTGGWEILRALRFGAEPLPMPLMPAGYRMRTTRDDDDDHRAIAALLNAAFDRTFHHAGELRSFQATAPSFRRDLDLIAVASDGTLAAYAAVCWDSRNARGIFEPVCTHPDHRQRGLAKALMLEGMRRARAMGAEVIDVGTGDMDPANALYDSLPFAEVYRGRFWEKVVAGQAWPRSLHPGRQGDGDG